MTQTQTVTLFVGMTSFLLFFFLLFALISPDLHENYILCLCYAWLGLEKVYEGLVFKWKHVWRDEKDYLVDIETMLLKGK